MPVMIEAEVVGRGSHHAKTTMAVAQRNGHNPGDVGPGGDVLVGLPGDVVGRVPDAEDGVQKQVEAAAASAHDQVGARDRVGEALARANANFLNAEQEHNA